jgi:circadian clock protein KaiC
LLATNIPFAKGGISRCSVEEAVVDGFILLSTDQSAMARERFVEIFKLGNTAHMMGRHKLAITRSGLAITLHKTGTKEGPSARPGQAIKTRVPASGKKHHGISKKKNKSRKG